MKLRKIEYYRCWQDGTWDTDFIDVPDNTPENQVQQAIQKAVEQINWKETPPVIVGLYHLPENEEFVEGL